MPANEATGLPARLATHEDAEGMIFAADSMARVAEAFVPDDDEACCAHAAKVAAELVHRYNSHAALLAFVGTTERVLLQSPDAAYREEMLAEARELLAAGRRG